MILKVFVDKRVMKMMFIYISLVSIFFGCSSKESRDYRLLSSTNIKSSCPEVVSSLIDSSYELTESQVLKKFKQEDISDTYLLEQAGNIKNKSLLDLLIKMEKREGFSFSDNVYKRLINANRLWHINKFSHEVLSFILSRTDSHLWISSDSISIISYVSKDYHRDLIIDFIKLYDKLPQNLKHDDDWPSYFVSSEIGYLINKIKSKNGADVIRGYYPQFPSRFDISINSEGFHQSQKVLLEFDLSLIENQWQAKFALMLLNKNTYPELEDATSRNNLHPFNIFTNNFHLIQTKEDLEKFQNFLRQSLLTRRLNKQHFKSFIKENFSN